ncbi:hypothetical protein Fuma_01028 [Fuerstiella marisgermanici]|uniref:Uncharacterized protein n=1 Tax=Fuerstiella marisgermanici TaxID=1891926 RepID=A0A1P8WBJ8_9PLAN|nr:hypothetical protein Fuma_01028 [Fuerstiella marisgermanici]
MHSEEFTCSMAANRRSGGSPITTRESGLKSGWTEAEWMSFATRLQSTDLHHFARQTL